VNKIGKDQKQGTKEDDQQLFSFGISINF